jgi:NADH dehydrogenase/NADH:ubiquinone oxidoreductase subunit G
MCDLGLAIGLIAGGLQAAGAADTAKKNQKMIDDQARMEHAAQAREFIVESNAANKEAYSSKLEADRNKSFLKTMSGSMGSTVGARNSEQARQGALSIANARDRSEAARANQAFAGMNTQIAATNRKATEAFTPIQAFSMIAGSGISNYGAFS